MAELLQAKEEGGAGRREGGTCRRGAIQRSAARWAREERGGRGCNCQYLSAHAT